MIAYIIVVGLLLVILGVFGYACLTRNEELKQSALTRVKEIIAMEVDYLEQTVVKDAAEKSADMIQQLYDDFNSDIAYLVSNADKKVIQEMFGDFSKYANTLKEQIVLNNKKSE